MELNAKAFGCAVGIVKGCLVFLGTIFVTFMGGGETLIKLNRFYIGYDISYKGAVIGLFYGLVDGFILAFIVASLYNFFAKEK